jgi:hypothetical protein
MKTNDGQQFNKSTSVVMTQKFEETSSVDFYQRVTRNTFANLFAWWHWREGNT